MGVIWNPQAEILREPNLLVPGKQPVGPVKLDVTHSLMPDGFALLPVLGPKAAIHNAIKPADSGAFGSGNDIRIVDGKLCYYFGGSAESGDINFAPIGTGDFTVIARIKTPATVGTYHALCASGSFAPGWLYLRLDNTQWGMYSAGDKRADTAVNLGYRHHLCVRRLGTGLAFYLDGVADGTATDSATHSQTSIMFGGNGSGTAKSGTIEYFYLYRRALSDSERLDITNDPYQFLIPA